MRPRYEKIFAALLALDLPKFQSRQQLEDVLASEIPDLVLRRFLLKNIGRNSEGGFFWKINLRGISENYLRLRDPVSAPAPFTKPALFIRGGNSNYLNPEDVPQIRKLFPQSEIQTIPNAGHWLHADRPAEFVKRVLKFLAD